VSNELTIIIPAFNEVKTIQRNIKTIMAQLSDDGLAASYLIVDDGSRDDTWGELTRLAAEHSSVSCLRLSRNYGKEAAIFAGLAEVPTPLCLVMDSDLQHPPRYIKEMLAIMRETGADVVEGVKLSRGRETLKYKLVAKFFYRAFHWLCGINLDGASDFKLFNRKAMGALKEFREGTVFFRGLVHWAGFKHETLAFHVDNREGDKSRFSTWRLIRFALMATLSHSSQPLLLPFALAAVFWVGGILLGGIALYGYFTGIAISGFTTVILLLLIQGALILFSLGIIGLYLARIYDEAKRRPRFFVMEKMIRHDAPSGQT